MTKPLNEWLGNEAATELVVAKAEQSLADPEPSLYTGIVPRDVIMQNPEKAIKEFGEGDPDLEELLRKCIGNKIETTGCCAGHPEKGDIYTPYIALSDEATEPSDQHTDFCTFVRLYAENCQGTGALNVTLFESEVGPVLHINNPEQKAEVFQDLASYLPEPELHMEQNTPELAAETNLAGREGAGKSKATRNTDEISR